MIEAGVIAQTAEPMPTGPAPHELFAQHPDLTEYLCHWSPRIGCIYVETPKAACTTIKRLLQVAELGPERRGDLPEDVHARETSPLLSPGQDPEGFVTALLDPATFCFAFVRNPYSRALSCWLDKMVANEFERARMAPMLGLDPDRPPSLADFLAASVRPAGGGARPPLGQPDPPAQSPRHQIRVYRPVRAFPRGVHPRLQASGDRGEGTGLPRTWHATGANRKVRTHIGETEAAMIRTIYEADFRNFGYGWGTGLI
jgi:hypothetical protein